MPSSVQAVYGFMADAPEEFVRVPQPLTHVGPRGRRGYPPQFVRKADPSSCQHPDQAISCHGSNQFGRRMRCMACDTLILGQKRGGTDAATSRSSRQPTAAQRGRAASGPASSST